MEWISSVILIRIETPLSMSRPNGLVTTSDTRSNRLGSISFDLDNLSEYKGFYGYSWSERSVCRIWELGLERIIEFLNLFDIKATFFVITDYLRFPIVRRTLEFLVSQGHELASHTHTHPYPFSHESRAAKWKEVEHSKKLLEDAFGVPVIGFRAPGYDIDSKTLDMLEECGYLYDSSIMPTVLNPLIVLASRLKSKWRTRSPFHWSHILAPLEPYYPKHGYVVFPQNTPRKIKEIPISVLPYIRYPFYPTFLNATGMIGLRLKYKLAKKLKFFVFEMHTIDFISHQDTYDIKELRNHPGIYYPYKIKIGFYEWIVKEMATTFDMKPIASILVSLDD